MPEELKDKTEPTASKVMRTPRSLTLEITARCNLRCRYCYFFNNPAVEYRDLPTDEWLTFFDELGSLGVMNVTLAGGEPFIREDLPELLEGIVRNRMRFSFLSNGGLIDDEIAAFIAGTGRCDYVQVSVDGSRAEIHDSCRGQGSFDGAIRGIRTLQRHRINVAVRVTIHRNNVHDLENIARFLLDELGLPDFGTNSAGYMGTCCANADDVLLTIAGAEGGHGDLAAPRGEIPRPHLGQRRPLDGRAHVAPDGGGAGTGQAGLSQRRPPHRLRLPEQQDLRARRRRHRSLQHAGPCRIGAHQPGFSGGNMAKQPGPEPAPQPAYDPAGRV